MTAKITKPKCIILDANVIIKACEIDIWTRLIGECSVVVPSIVVHAEAIFYNTTSGVVVIDLPELVTLGKLKEEPATAEELTAIYRVFDRLFAGQMHDGELEALALLKSEKLADAVYCTGDGPAIEALALLDLSYKGISMEKLLLTCGLKKPLEQQYTEPFFKKHLEIGAVNRVTGVGLANKGKL
jgi:hypothetical protein